MAGKGRLTVTSVTANGDIQSTHQYNVSVKFEIGFDYGGYNSAKRPYSITCDGQTKSGSNSFSVSSGNGTFKYATMGTQTFTITMPTSGAAKTISCSATCSTGVTPATITGSTSYTLPAVTWEYTVSYDANGGTGAPDSQKKTHGTTLTLSSTIPTRDSVITEETTTHYVFKGWATSATATSPEYSAGSSYTANAATTLYAVWQATTSLNITEYNVSFNTNGGSPVSPQIKDREVPLTLTTDIPTKYGYRFDGWNTQIDGRGVKYRAGSTYSIDADIILYAIWIPWKHTVVYKANGCYSRVPRKFVKTKDVYASISDYEPVRRKYKFIEWNTKKDGTGVSYKVGDSYDVLQDGGIVNLYAIWVSKDVFIYNNNTCAAIEFVEGADDTMITKDGIVYCPEIIETENGTIQLNIDGIHCFETMESFTLFYLKDGDGTALTDESGNYLYSTIHM